MGGKINKGDTKILTALADFGLLIPAQLSAITQRSAQVIKEAFAGFEIRRPCERNHDNRWSYEQDKLGIKA